MPARFLRIFDFARSALTPTRGRNGFDYLVSNASIGEISGFAETTEAQFGRFFDIHVKGVFFLTRALLPLLVDRGRIVDVSSKRRHAGPQ